MPNTPPDRYFDFLAEFVRELQAPPRADAEDEKLRQQIIAAMRELIIDEKSVRLIAPEPGKRRGPTPKKTRLIMEEMRKTVAEEGAGRLRRMKFEEMRARYGRAGNKTLMNARTNILDEAMVSQLLAENSER